jgi:hypothetical protein
MFRLCGHLETTVHPANRAERRHQRIRVMAIHRRKHLINKRYLQDVERYGEPVWGRYVKWNGNCGSPMCHAGKYFKNKARRRNARKSALSPAEARVEDRKLGNAARRWLAVSIRPMPSEAQV